MVIKKIEIGGFGKLEGYNLNLNDGVQIIYGANEFGKSTVMEFLKMMFYSRRGSERSNFEDKILRQRYAPWSGVPMRGSIEFVHDENLYKIQKEINPESPSRDSILIINKSNGETINLGKKEEAGEYFFGIDIKSFERSSYIRSTGKTDFESSKNSKDNIADKILSNLSDTGEVDVSKSLITKRLGDAIRDLEWARGNGGKIFEAKSLINEINKKIYDLKLFEENREKLVQESDKLKALRSELKSLQLKVEAAEKFCKLSKINEIIKLNDKRENDIKSLGIPYLKSNEIIKELLELKEETKRYITKVTEFEKIINALDKNIISKEEKELDDKLKEANRILSKLKRKKTTISVLQIFNFFALISAFCISFFMSTFVPVLIYSLPFALTLASCVYFIKKTRDRLKINSSYISALFDLQNAESKFIKNISKYRPINDFSETSKALDSFISLSSEIKSFEEKIKYEADALGFNNPDLDFLKKYAKKLRVNNEEAEYSPSEIKKFRERIEFLKNLNLEEKYIEIQKNMKTPFDSVENLIKKLTEQKNKLSDMETYLESLKIASIAIEEVSDELRKNFSPKLSSRVSEIFSCLTGGKYAKLHVDKNYGMLVNSDAIERTCDDFSSGTIDQAYLALRIAISELISSMEKIPLILDDVFMQYDNDRLERALEFLKDYSLKNQGKCQIIIFTCHKHIADLAASKEIQMVFAD